MHPNQAFRFKGDEQVRRALLETMLDEIGFGMVFMQTPDGPRVAHVPLVSTGDGAVQFHLARGNAMAKYLDGATVLAVINGPDGYVSPRWADDPQTVPTWNYVTLELEGRVRRLGSEALTAILEDLTTRHEGRIAGGEAWTLDKLTPERLRGLLAGIVGFELEVQVWRETLKLSQNKDDALRARLADALEGAGNSGIATMMRTLAK